MDTSKQNKEEKTKLAAFVEKASSTIKKKISDFIVFLHTPLFEVKETGKAKSVPKKGRHAEKEARKPEKGRADIDAGGKDSKEHAKKAGKKEEKKKGTQSKSK